MGADTCSVAIECLSDEGEQEEERQIDKNKKEDAGGRKKVSGKRKTKSLDLFYPIRQLSSGSTVS